MSDKANWASKTRADFVSALKDVGPDAPTLCTGWNARDLAAHVIIRERRPDAALGIVVPFASTYTDKVMAEYRDKDWETLVSLIEGGAPAWNPMSFPAIAEVSNTLEFFVHTEDILRAQPQWKARELDKEFADVLWRRLSALARLQWRRAHVGVTLMNGKEALVAKSVSANGLSVTIEGDVAELVMKSFGRTQCTIHVTGTDNSIAVFDSTNLKF